jgi:hypothetical protein
MIRLSLYHADKGREDKTRQGHNFRKVAETNKARRGWRGVERGGGGGRGGLFPKVKAWAE